MPAVISEGNRVEISLDREEKTTSYISVVEEVCDNNLILIQMPISYGSLVKLPMGINYKMLFYTEKGMFNYTAKVVKYVKKENFNLMLVELCSEGEKFQRREFFRYEYLAKFNFDRLDENETQDEFDFNNISLEGLIKDISAGGIRFVSDEKLDVDDLIKCNVPIGEDYIVSSAKIVQKQQYYKENYKFQYRAEFLSIKESERDMIIRYIYNEQIRTAKKS